MFRTRLVAGAAALAVIGLLVSATVVSQEHDKKQEKPTTMQPPEGGAAMAEEMAKWAAFATPGPEHEFFAKMAGKWDFETKTWMSGPDGEPMVSPGVCEMKLIFDGRYLLSTVKGTWMGMPFEGMGIDGYDNLRQEYTSVWIDSMGTGIMTMTGHADASGKVISYEGTMSDPGTGEKHKKCSTVIRLESKDRVVMEMYDKVGTKDQYKAMEITYKRRK